MMILKKNLNYPEEVDLPKSLQNVLESLKSCDLDMERCHIRNEDAEILILTGKVEEKVPGKEPNTGDPMMTTKSYDCVYIKYIFFKGVKYHQWKVGIWSKETPVGRDYFDS